MPTPFRIDAERGIVAREEPTADGLCWSYRHGAPLFREFGAAELVKSNGASMGNVLEMHNGEPVGSILNFIFDDDDRSIWAVLQIDSESALRKVTEGCYTGLSHGGHYVRRWPATVDGVRVEKFTLAPFEISLTDSPRIQSAQLARFQKGEGVPSAALRISDPLLIARADELRWEQMFSRCRPNAYF